MNYLIMISGPRFLVAAADAFHRAAGCMDERRPYDDELAETRGSPYVRGSWWVEAILSLKSL